MDTTWKTFALRTLFGCVAIFATVRLALARDGVSGGSARSFVTVAGTLTGVNTPAVVMTFAFHRRGGAALCAPQVRDVAVAAGGAFSAHVPLDEEPTRCPATLFDGSDVQVDVQVGSEVVARNAEINPVPYAHYASQYGTPDCPVGYDRDMSEAPIVLCRKCRGPGRFENCYDDIVRVGTGASAFWIDRYEASVWATEAALPDSRRGLSEADYGRAPAAVPPHGDYSGSSLFARSVPAVLPSSRMTWFQAQAFCFASGKRLPSLHEWQLAIRGTTKPERLEFGDGRDRGCLTSVDRAQVTGNRSPSAGMIGCQSVWGAQDMIGNLREWIADWMSTIVTSSSPDANVADYEAWPAGYPRDLMANVISYASSDGNGTRRRVPAALVVGGGFLDGPAAGLFYLVAGSAPSDWNGVTGFRCVIPR